MLKKLNSQNMNTNFTLLSRKQMDRHIKKRDLKLLTNGIK